MSCGATCRPSELLIGSCIVVASGLFLLWHEARIRRAAQALSAVLDAGLHPIRSLTSAIRRLGDGNFDVLLPGLDRKDEIGDIARAIDDLKIEDVREGAA